MPLFFSRNHVKSSVMVSIQAQLHVNDLFSRFSHSLFLQVRFYLGMYDGVVGLPRWLSGKKSPANSREQEMQVQSLGPEDPLEKGMATHSSILAWKTPWAEEPDGLWFMGSHRVRHN